MTQREAFRAAVQGILNDIDPEILSYDESEFWMIQPAYEYIAFFAAENSLINTAVALPLARGLHNGSHRKSSVQRQGVTYRLPYVIHCLIVCRILLDIKAPLSREETDILLAAALCHDMVEDIPFPNHGTELYTQFHLDPRVYETVKLVSKRKDFTEEEENTFFHNIESNKLALLVKLSDRSHNVEDLYNMSVWKVHEYIGETNRFFLPMCAYGEAHYPELVNTIEVLRDKIISLTRASEIMVDRCEAREQELKSRLAQLQEENAALHRRYNELMGG